MLEDNRVPLGDSGERQNRPFGVLRRMWRLLVRVDLASLLLLILILVVALGSCFPSRPSSLAADAQRLADWKQEVRAKYGRLTDLLHAIGAFRWFRSPVVWIPAGLLVFATLVCTIARSQGTWERAFDLPIRWSQTSFESGGYSAELSLPPSANPTCLVRRVLEQQGFRVRSRVDGDVITWRGDRNALASLATLVTHGAVVLLMLGVVVSSRLGWREELTLEPHETVSIQNIRGAGGEAGLHLRSEGVSVTRYPDGSVAGYDVEIAVIEGGRKAARRHIHLNRPAIYQGVAFYLKSYRPREQGHSVTLQAVHDPGYGPVVAAGLLLFLGLTVSFNFPHCWIRARLEPEGRLRLVGHPDRRVWDFEREFDGLVGSLAEG